MAYVALYRKFRPETFEEVKGQDAIVTTLKNQMKNDRVGHAYLFCGTRGTGKTSMAKLLAKAVNCDHPVDGSPCGECESCRKIASGAALNVVEIDAASNNGVDNIRQINEGVQYAPADGKKMVYIIDEVHMLSMGAFNALLKTLEEPPSYVIFILATTELHKVPVTIKSRCQRYDFRRIPYTVIADRMQEILDAEGTKASRDALEFIARAADGSMRDALSLLDQCVSYYLGQELTLDMALEAIGAVDTELFLKLETGIVKDDAEGVMNLVSEVVWRGTELTRFTEDFCMFLRNVLFLKLSPELGRTLDMTEDTIAKLAALGQTIPEDTLVRQIRVLQDMLPELRLSTVKRVALEMGMLRLLRPEMDKDMTGILARLDRLENRADKAEESAAELMQRTEELEKRPAAVVSVPVSGSVDSGNVSENREEPELLSEAEASRVLHEHFDDAKAEEILELAKAWNREVMPKLDHAMGRLIRTVPIKPTLNQEGKAIGITLFLRKEDINPFNYFHVPENQEFLRQEICRITGKNVNITVANADGSDSGGAVNDLPALSKMNFDIEVK